MRRPLWENMNCIFFRFITLTFSYSLNVIIIFLFTAPLALRCMTCSDPKDWNEVWTKPNVVDDCVNLPLNEMLIACKDYVATLNINHEIYATILSLVWAIGNNINNKNQCNWISRILSCKISQCRVRSLITIFSYISILTHSPLNRP